MYRTIGIASLAFTALCASAAVRVQEFVVQPLVLPEHRSFSAELAGSEMSEPSALNPFRSDAAPATMPFASGEPSMLAVYPVAGTIGRDLVVPYYVDLDPGDARLDFDCGRLTFNGHEGHDPYIRSFAEQRIGVPVFAVRDGTVIEIRDGEPDENTTNDPALRSNFISIRHSADEVSYYVHLKRDSISVRRGDFVTAGTQIGLVGSSGPSTAPHIHFEMQFRGEAYEPMAGSCRPGPSYLRHQPAASREPVLLGATFSERSFADAAPAPFDEAPRTGTFLLGQQAVYFKADLAHVGATTSYQLLLQPPGSGSAALASSGTLVRYDTSLASLWWGLEVDLNRTGTWNLILRVNDRQEFVLPFSVVASPEAVANRPPHPVAAVLEPVVATQVAVCRADGGLVRDPDYDVVRYRYEWRVDGDVVRDVTSAATTDALPREFSRPGAEISCSVTASDGSASAQPNTAYVTVSETRRRGVRH